MFTNPFSMPLPGALRVRALYPLIDGDGSCSLIYDLERAAVLEVPEELQFHVAPALETGDLDEALVDWMVGEDLLTCDGRAGSGEDWEGTAPASSADGGWWHLGAIARRDGEIHARIDHASGPGAPGAPAVGEAMHFVFRQSLGASRVTFHLGWAGSLPDTALLAGLVIEARRRAAAQGQEARFELSLDAAAVTPAAVAVLADLPVHVRLQCGSFPGLDEEAQILESRAWQTAEAAVRQLRPIGERVTVHCILAGGARLLDLWSWAKQAGVRHLDALRMEGPAPAGQTWSSEVRVFRGDLQAVYEEMVSNLEAGRLPIDFEPLTRVVRRLMRRGSASRLDRLAGDVRALPSLGDVYLRGAEDLDAGLVGEGRMVSAGDGCDEADEQSGPTCRGCWARHACTHSSLSAASLDAWDRREPSEERCALWRTEAEVALRFYHRLAHVDPLQVMTLFEEAARVPVDPFERPFPGWHQKSAF